MVYRRILYSVLVFLDMFFTNIETFQQNWACQLCIQLKIQFRECKDELRNWNEIHAFYAENCFVQNMLLMELHHGKFKDIQ